MRRRPWTRRQGPIEKDPELESRDTVESRSVSSVDKIDPPSDLPTGIPVDWPPTTDLPNQGIAKEIGRIGDLLDGSRDADP